VDSARFLPLPTAALHILLALTDGEKHGYAIMGDVERLSGGAVKIGPGTLYGSIKRMLADGLIEESDERPDPRPDDQRRLLEDDLVHGAVSVGSLATRPMNLALVVQRGPRRRSGES
jgi:Transcriptional regulator PadR-like family